MPATITFFPVDNGDMTLIELESGRKILMDMNIRVAADDDSDDTPDVAKKLRDQLKRDGSGRLFVDAFLLSHPDKDHCSGLERHFHLGAPDDWSKEDDKIFIREIWSSPRVFRRASANNTLCPDAKAFNTEARRRVKRFRETNGVVGDGDRVLILGEDTDGKTDDLGAILVKVDETFSKVNGQRDGSMVARLLAPLPVSEDEEEEDLLDKNHSSTILRFSLAGDGVSGACKFLTAGDAEVAIWERLWRRHQTRKEWLEYDVLLAPHHCSWHSLSYDSWGKLKEKAQVCQEARNALSQAKKGAVIVASSKAIKDDDNDPPCIRAKREYLEIVGENWVRGEFKCVGEYPSEKAPDTMEFEIGWAGPRRKTKSMGAAAIVGTGAVGRQPLGHG
jgi:hypothetical protein